MPARRVRVQIRAEEPLRAQVTLALGPVFHVVAEDDRQRGPERVRCTVLSACEFRRVARDSWTSGGGAPTVVVDEGVRSGAPALHRRPFASVEARRLYADLARVVTRAVFNELFDRLLDEARFRGLPAGPARRAVLRALSVPPVLRVQRLALEIDCAERTLRKEWRQAQGHTSSEGLKPFLLDVFWLRVLEARLANGSASWEAVAQGLDVSVNTLRRLAERHLSATLSVIDVDSAVSEALRLEGDLVAVVRRASDPSNRSRADFVG